MSWLDGFALLSLVYIGVGIGYLVRFIKNWRSLWDERLTPEDAKLAAGSAFFLLIPPTVALHELGHAAAIWAYGQEVIDFVFYGYMGAVAHHPTAAGDFGNFVIALAGNVVTAIIAGLSFAFAMTFPGHPVRNILAIELGRQSAFLVLVFYPLLCIVFPGDFQTIYDITKTPIASVVTLVIHLVVLFGGLAWWKRRKSRAMLLCSPVARDFVAAERASDTRKLGLMYAMTSDYQRVRTNLAAHVETLDARQKAVYGRALLECGDVEEALEVLEEAAKRLLRAEERDEVQRLRVQALGRLGRDREAQEIAASLGS